MTTLPTYLTRQVETTKIFNWSAEFRDWWVGGGLEFSKPAINGFVKNIGIYPLSPTRTHP